MGKRSSTVILSSDDDEEASKHSSLSSKSKLINSKSSSESKPVTSASRCSKAKASKKARVSSSCFATSASKERKGFDELELFFEDIAEGFSGFKVSAGYNRIDGLESWVDKYRPHNFEELAVHKKKIEEVMLWFEERFRTPKKETQNHVLLITGPTGVGKSATVNVIASYFGARVCEWNTPIPTIWQEHIHNSASGMRYVSKLDEFENFVERARKYALLPSSVYGTATSVILLIDDLPVASGKVAYGRLLKCLQLLVKSARIPTVILISDYGRADSGDAHLRYLEELVLSLESAGACKVAFNPITLNTIRKTLSRICRLEQCHLTSEQINVIVNASGGDIRHAITSLQYFCLKPSLMITGSSTKCCPADLEVKSHDVGYSLPFGRDQTLSLFHALGKFLHNKREIENDAAFCENEFPLKEAFFRFPLKMDAPEKVLCQAYGQARPVAEFLHENVVVDLGGLAGGELEMDNCQATLVGGICLAVLDFLSEEAIEDAWAVSAYLSDADCLLSSNHWMVAKSYEVENVVQSIAASVAVRGVLFGNAHPSPSRWHTIRRPKLWNVEKSACRNKYELERQRLVGYNGSSLCNMSIISIDYIPMLKWLGSRVPLCYGHLQMKHGSTQGRMEEDDEFDCMNSRNDESGTTDDEIEDWE